LIDWLQISGREMFEFNPELIEGDDADADDSATYQPEAHDDDVRSLTHSALQACRITLWPDLQNILRFIIRLSEVYRTIGLR